MPTQPHHLVINPVFDSSVTSSPEKTEFESAVNSAISYLESKIVTPITVSISFGYGEVGGQSIPPASGAESIGTDFGYTYAQFYDAIQAADKTSPIQIAAAASLPQVDPTGGATMFIAAAEALALGLSIGSLTGGLVGNVGLSVDNYAWSETGSIGAGQSDAVSELEHEITEVLGRTDQGGDGDSYSPLDFFRYTAANGLSGDAPGSAAGARDEPFVTGYSANAFSYFSYDGKHVTLQYDTPALVASGADIADWNQATTGNDSFDGVGSPGAFYPVSTTDLAEMNVLGFELAPPRDNFAGNGISDLLIENTGGTIDLGQFAPGGRIGFTYETVVAPTWTFEGTGDYLDEGHDQFLIENSGGTIDLGQFTNGKIGFSYVTVLASQWKFEGNGDFLGKDSDQLLIENTGGMIEIGQFSAGKIGFSYVTVVAPTWSFVGTGDYLGEGHDQFLIENTSGMVEIGQFSSGKIGFSYVTTVASEWKFVGTGDYLGAGHDEFLIENTSGVVDIGQFASGKIGFTYLTTVASEWKFVGTGDYLGEGHDQFLLENTSGEVLIGDLNAGALHFALAANLAPQWTIHG